MIDQGQVWLGHESDLDGAVHGCSELGNRARQIVEVRETVPDEEDTERRLGRRRWRFYTHTPAAAAGKRKKKDEECSHVVLSGAGVVTILRRHSPPRPHRRNV